MEATSAEVAVLPSLFLYVFSRTLNDIVPLLSELTDAFVSTYCTSMLVRNIYGFPTRPLLGVLARESCERFVHTSETATVRVKHPLPISNQSEHRLLEPSQATIAVCAFTSRIDSADHKQD